MAVRFYELDRRLIRVTYDDRERFVSAEIYQPESDTFERALPIQRQIETSPFVDEISEQQAEVLRAALRDAAKP